MQGRLLYEIKFIDENSPMYCLYTVYIQYTHLIVLIKRLTFGPTVFSVFMSM